MRIPDDRVVPDVTVGPLIQATHQDPWKKVAAQASQGNLVFHPAAAEAAAKECADVMGTVSALRQEISQMGRLNELSHLASGWYLADQINGTTDTIDTVMGSFRTVLGEMLDTFKRAGRNYLDSDELSAAGFPGPSRQAMRAALDGIRASDEPGKLSRQPPDAGREPATFSKGSNTEIAAVGARDLTGAGGTGREPEEPIEADELVRPAAMNDNMLDLDVDEQSKPELLQRETLETGGGLENPYSQSWRDLYDLGVSTQNAVKPVYHQAQMWKWVAGEMDAAVGGLADRLARMPDSLWDGAGAAAAKAAVRDYHTRAQDLTTRMESFGGNLDYTSRWLKNTAKGMPNSPEPPESYYQPGHPVYSPYGGSVRTAEPATDAEIARHLAIHRQNMENNYVVGVQNSSGYLPAFEELPSATSPPVNTTPQADASGETTTTPTGGGSTAPTGGGPTPIGGAPPMPGGPVAGGAPATPPGTRTAGPGFRGGSPVEPATVQVPTGAAPRNSGTAAGPTDSAGQVGDLAGQGLRSAASAAEQAANQAVPPGGIPRLPGSPGMPPAAPTGGLRSGGLPAGGAGGGGTGSGGSSPAAPPLRNGPSLFPRASIEGPAAGARWAGAAAGTSTPMHGVPGTPGAGAGGQGQQDKDHNRGRFLRSKKHLDEAIGAARTFTRSIVE